MSHIQPPGMDENWVAASHFCHFITQVPYSRTCRLGESSPLAAASPRRTRVLRRTHRTASLRPRRYTERTPRWQVCRIPHRISAELRFWRAPESTSPALLLLVPPLPSNAVRWWYQNHPGCAALLRLVVPGASNTAVDRALPPADAPTCSSLSPCGCLSRQRLFFVYTLPGACSWRLY